MSKRRKDFLSQSASNKPLHTHIRSREKYSDSLLKDQRYDTEDKRKSDPEELNYRKSFRLGPSHQLADPNWLSYMEHGVPMAQKCVCQCEEWVFTFRCILHSEPQLTQQELDRLDDVLGFILLWSLWSQFEFFSLNFFPHRENSKRTNIRHYELWTTARFWNMRRVSKHVSEALDLFIRDSSCSMFWLYKLN